VLNLKLPCGPGQYAMPAVQSDAKKVTAHRFGNGAKETSSRFLHYSPRLNFGTFVPTTVLILAAGKRSRSIFRNFYRRLIGAVERTRRSPH